jgi:hypothetical protein
MNKKQLHVYPPISAICPVHLMHQAPVDASQYMTQCVSNSNNPRLPPFCTRDPPIGPNVIAFWLRSLCIKFEKILRTKNNW